MNRTMSINIDWAIIKACPHLVTGYVAVDFSLCSEQIASCKKAGYTS